MIIFSSFVITIKKSFRKHLFHIRNKQYLLCTSGNFHATHSCQSKDMMKITKGPVFSETRCILHGSRHLSTFGTEWVLEMCSSIAYALKCTDCAARLLVVSRRWAYLAKITNGSIFYLTSDFWKHWSTNETTLSIVSMFEVDCACFYGEAGIKSGIRRRKERK